MLKSDSTPVCEMALKFRTYKQYNKSMSAYSLKAILLLRFCLVAGLLLNPVMSYAVAALPCGHSHIDCQLPNHVEVHKTGLCLHHHHSESNSHSTDDTAEHCCLEHGCPLDCFCKLSLPASPMSHSVQVLVASSLVCVDCEALSPAYRAMTKLENALQSPFDGRIVRTRHCSLIC